MVRQLFTRLLHRLTRPRDVAQGPFEFRHRGEQGGHAVIGRRRLRLVVSNRKAVRHG